MVAEREELAFWPVLVICTLDNKVLDNKALTVCGSDNQIDLPACMRTSLLLAEHGVYEHACFFLWCTHSGMKSLA